MSEMEVIQVAFNVPPAISIGLKSGVLELCGGVVCDSKSKQVVTWLKEANVFDENAAEQVAKVVKQAGKPCGVETALRKASDVLRRRKELVIAAGVVSVAAFVAGGVYHLVVKRKGGKAIETEIDPRAVRLDDAVKSYSEAASSGHMTAEVIDELCDAISDIKDDDCDVAVSVKSLKRFLEPMRSYTKNLCKANGVSTKGLSASARKNDIESVVSCLDFQRKVFENVA